MSQSKNFVLLSPSLFLIQQYPSFQVYNNITTSIVPDIIFFPKPILIVIPTMHKYSYHKYFWSTYHVTRYARFGRQNSEQDRCGPDIH